MSLYSRLGLNFDTSQFGDAQTLSSKAANTLNLVASTAGGLKDWQVTDLSAGPVNKSSYFQNPTTTYTNSMLGTVGTILTTANTANDNIMLSAAQNLLIELSAFHSHTDNISGVVVVTNTLYPSLQSAQNIGQLNMMTLARTDGVTNTAPILGSFTSLFIQDELQANTNTISYYATEYSNSLVANTVVDPISGNTSTSYSSNLPSGEITSIENYLTNTKNLLAARRTNDWSFYQNSMQLAQDVGFYQQLNNMGGTMTYLVNNVIGTPSLISKLSSS